MYSLRFVCAILCVCLIHKQCDITIFESDQYIKTFIKTCKSTFKFHSPLCLHRCLHDNIYLLLKLKAPQGFLSQRPAPKLNLKAVTAFLKMNPQILTISVNSNTCCFEWDPSLICCCTGLNDIGMFSMCLSFSYQIHEGGILSETLQRQCKKNTWSSNLDWFAFDPLHNAPSLSLFFLSFQILPSTYSPHLISPAPLLTCSSVPFYPSEFIPSSFSCCQIVLAASTKLSSVF